MEKPRKEKNQNIQVFVRLRPLNQRERDIRSLGVVEVCSNREVLVRQSQAPSITKKFTFDRAFGPNSKQVDVYHEVVSPLIEEVLAGYNCTVFAYGQTGTGKTHTMVGESSDHVGSKQSDPMAGIIPRSLGQLFDELRLSNSEFTVRVSYLELYNEELFDLLAPSNGDSKLKMYEASKGSSEVKGLEEIRVRSKDEVYQILAQGQERRRIASTLMNAQSSRSHTVFTIVVKMNMKDSGTEGEELVKTGKLNLVDLAGSENISKAGSDNPGKGDRKRECVVINQSLLTLGRVITALVERQPHIPYRESKLTRLLQESLGGRTKTSIIATISPGHKDLEETLSTLEYAHRARNIQNKPEVNQKVLKTTVLTEYVDENDRLRRDLMASWEKNGVYLSLTTHTETQMQLANQRKEIQEQILQIKSMKEETERLELDLREKVEGLRQTEELLEGTKHTLGQTKEELGYTKNHLSKMSNLYEEQRYIVSKQSETEAQLSKEALEARRAAELAGSDAGHLHCTVAKRRKLEEENYSATVAYGAAAREQRARMRGRLHSATDTLAVNLTQLSQAFEQHLAESLKRQEESKQQVSSLVQQMDSAVAEVISTIGNTQEELALKTSAHEAGLRERVSAHGASAASRLGEWSERLSACLEEGRRRERRAVDDIRQTAEQWRGTATLRLQELESEHASWLAAWSQLQAEAEEASRKEAQRRRGNANSFSLGLMTEQQEMAAAKERLIQELDRIMSRNQMMFKEFISSSDMEMDRADEDFKNQQEMREKARSLVGSYSDAFQEKMAVVGSDVEAFSRNVVEKVTEAHESMFAEADKANEATKVEMMEVVASVERESEQMSSDASELLAASLQSGRDALDTARSHIHQYTDTCSSGVTAVSQYVEREWCAGAEEWGRGAGDVRALGGRLQALREELHAEFAAQESLQESFLQQDYKTYSPTGKTPERTEYRYPRTFAATSPHDRLVARLRAQRSRSHDECIEVLDATLEPANEAGGSDTDSSRLSTDSAVVFLEPSPPPAATPTMTTMPAITKSTSESDIFSKRKNGKENLSQAVSLQKLSKLRQPNSHKKILTPKN